MAWFKGLLGGMAGAFGYSQVKDVETKDIAQGILGILARDGGGSKTTVVASRVDPQMNELTKQLRELQMQIQANRSQPVTIVTGHSGNKGYSYIIVPTGMLGVVLLYLRYVKGWRITDFMYVTRASLQGLKATVVDLQTNLSAGITKMQEEVQHKTKVLVQHLGLVQKTQNELLEQQQALDGRVEELGANVDEQMTQLNGNVQHIQLEMGDMHHKVDVSTRGMLLLCQSIADMCRFVNFNGQSVNAIESYLQGAASAAILPPPGAGGSQQQLQQQQQPAAIQGPPPLPALPAGPSDLPPLDSLLTISEEPTAAPTASVAPAPASGAPSSSTPGQASTSRNARSKSDSTDARSQNYRGSPYFNMFSMGRNTPRSSSLPASQP